jgi:alanine dehydrogenase
MIIGIPKEIKNNEFRVGMVPAGVERLCALGHKIIVEKSAGLGCGITDEACQNAGAMIASDSRMIFKQAQMIIKVKEVLPDEYDLLEQGQIIFTYFHFVADGTLAQALLEKKITAIAYETIQTSDGHLPLLEPMSEIAGRMAIQEGAKYLEKPFKGFKKACLENKAIASELNMVEGKVTNQAVAECFNLAYTPYKKSIK